MWLINTTSLQLRSFRGKPPPYAILSHRWGFDEEEVSFQEWQDDHSEICHRPGFIKILKACHQAKTDELDYLWVDTNCIDKSSSAQLSEAINSMYQYYCDAVICYAYLCDVQDAATPSRSPSQMAGNTQFHQSGWFTRGWTLQELLAPNRVVFFTSSWSRIGTKAELKEVIAAITRIPLRYLHHPTLREATISCRMSWVSNRVTTRLEDIAYCMLGIFNINMPLLYGEGRRAFQRLQEELIKSSDDQTIFAWDWLPRFKETGRASPRFPALRCTHLVDSGWDVKPAYTDDDYHYRQYTNAPEISSSTTSLFAPDPVFFYASSEVGYYKSSDIRVGYDDDDDGDVSTHALGRVSMSEPYFVTNKGMSITLPLHDPSVHGTRPQPLTCWRLGDPQPLAMITAHPHAGGVSSSGICEGVAVFLRAVGRKTSTYDRATELDEVGHVSVSLFRGHLMSVTMPLDWFKKYFRRSRIFVPSSRSVQSIFAWDQAPEAAVWLLNDFAPEETLRMELFLSCGPPNYKPDHSPLFPPLFQSLLKRGAASLGAIYKVTYSRTEPLWRMKQTTSKAYVLVRAVRRAKPFGDPGTSFRWGCHSISPAKVENSTDRKSQSTTDQSRECRDLLWWEFAGQSLTLQQILDTHPDPCPGSVVDDATEVLLTLGRRKIRILLGGSAHWVTNPASSMRFLCADVVKD